MVLKRVSVFCGSSRGIRPAYARAAGDLGQALLRRRIGLIYGGGRVGLMYEVARIVHEGKGEVIGIIPRGLVERELAFTELNDLRVVGSMHERKALMTGLSDAFIALPGGLGTVEEFFEVLTWAQLGMHAKPCGLLNVEGYFDRMLEFLNHAASEKFLQPEHRMMIQVDRDPEALLAKLETYIPPDVDMARWALDMTET